MMSFEELELRVSLGATSLMADSFILILMPLTSLIDSVGSASWCMSVTSAASGKHILYSHIYS